MRYSINKYGKENHTIEYLEFFNNRELLIEREKEVVNLNEIAKENCMNLMVGGKGGFISEEQQRRRAIAGGNAFAKKLKEDPIFREKHRQLVSANMKKLNNEGKIKRYDNTGIKHKKETINKMCLSKIGHGIGNKNSQYGTCWITNGVNAKKIKKTDKIPNGWKLGRKI